jgi:mitochondrial FAD-linked sulfhydryl oxidase
MPVADYAGEREYPVPIPYPPYWGPQFWFTMHTVAYFYSDTPSPTEMAHAKEFYASLASLLPCPGCASHYAHLLAKHPVDHAIRSRMMLMQWVNMIHNEVNRRLGKPIVTFEEYLMRMKHIESPPLMRTEPIIAGVILALLVLVASRYYYMRRH